MSSLVCGICTKPATKYCSLCIEKLCDDCNTYLHKGRRSGHTVSDISDYENFKKNINKCEVHKDEYLKIQCKTCNTMVCLACASTTHSSHELNQTDITRLKKQDELAFMIKSLEKQLDDMVNADKVLEERHEEIVNFAVDFFTNLKKEQIEKITKHEEHLKGILQKIDGCTIGENSTMEDVTNVINKRLQIPEANKLRIDPSLTTMVNKLNAIGGLTISIESSKNEEFDKFYAEAYNNRNKNWQNTLTLVERYLKIYPLSLLLQALKAECLIGLKEVLKAHQILNNVVKQPIYDSYDEFAVGEAYYLGETKEESLKYYKLSVEKGNMYAEHKFGTLYYNGDENLKIEKNKKEAFKYFQRAASKGVAMSQYNVAYCYFTGDAVQRNKEEAVKWFKLAAEQGYTVAEYKLGSCYEIGSGVEINLEEAKKYYQRAAAKGHEAAIAALDLLEPPERKTPTKK